MSSLQQNWRRGQNRFCLEARGWRARGRNGLNNICTYEHMNKGKMYVLRNFVITKFYC
jgi:hypothetical protein